MSAYIDKDRVLEYIIFGVVGKEITSGELKRAIESIPTIDIVHCKDCIRFDGEDCCERIGMILYPEDVERHFCGYGERIEE